MKSQKTAKKTKCRVEIESDSYYCDQCGVELYICPQCHVFGKGKRCTQCGQPLVSAANQVVSPVHPSTSSVNSSASSVSPASSEPEKTMRPGVSVPPLPVRLVCSAAGIRLGLGNGAVIGRRKGDYVSAFASQGYFSHPRPSPRHIVRNHMAHARSDGRWTVETMSCRYNLPPAVSCPCSWP